MAVFSMIALVAAVLSMSAGFYFRQAALDAQMKSLSRVIEVAAQEMLKQVETNAFELGMKLGHSREIVEAARTVVETGQNEALITLLDDPFITGFASFSDINLVKLRVFDLDMKYIAESNQGIQGIGEHLPPYLQDIISKRDRIDRLKAVDALWLSSEGPLFSAVVLLGGLRPEGYLEVVIDPVLNLPDISKITQTPVSIFSMKGEQISGAQSRSEDEYLPVEYVLHTSDGFPAFRIVGLENVATLSREMKRTQVITISGFLLLSLATLLLALWLFNRFMLLPLSSMTGNMMEMARGKLDLSINDKGLSEFHLLANSFNAMANQVRMRTNDLERILDLDESAIICFDQDQEVVFFNEAAKLLFGYSNDEFRDLGMIELFVDDVPSAISSVDSNDNDEAKKLHTTLLCKHSDGHEFECTGDINTIDVLEQNGQAIALNPVTQGERTQSAKNEQRLEAIEHSISSLLNFAKENPSLMLGLDNIADLSVANLETATEKALIREKAVNVMSLSLACWERELGKSKLDLAEESRIWPVYMDKSTPTTRTLDKYLNLELCPKNPRSKRVMDTAEFVLRSAENKSSRAREKLRIELAAFRQLLSGLKPPVAGSA